MLFDSTRDAEGKNYDLEVEKELLGMLLKDNNLIDQADFLLPENFYDPLHSIIFETINNIIDRYSVADVAGVHNEIGNKKEFLARGGKDYLRSLTLTVSFATAQDRAMIIHNLYLKRSLVRIGQEITSSANQRALGNISEEIAKAEAKLYHLSSGIVGGGEFKKISAEIKEVISHLDNARKKDKAITGLHTGLNDLDEMIGGLKKSDLVILAARPSMGKTALALNMLYHISKEIVINKEDAGVAFFSLEMSAQQIAVRIASMHTLVNSRTFETGRYNKLTDSKIGKISDHDFKNITKSLDDLAKLPLYIDDTPAITISTLHSRARRIVKKNKVGAIFIDYLQLIRGSHSGNSYNRVQEVSEVTQGLKAIAKELNVPVIALSQLSRAVEGRDDKKPQLSDLRESGSIEQDADIVAFLYREIYYLERQKPEDPGEEPSMQDQERWSKWRAANSKMKTWQEKCENIDNLAELIIAKNRNGPVGSVELAFDKSYNKFSNRAKINISDKDISIDDMPEEYKNIF